MHTLEEELYYVQMGIVVATNTNGEDALLSLAQAENILPQIQRMYEEELKSEDVETAMEARQILLNLRIIKFDRH
jgi:hypothetical protein